ncbi:hypothetical protein ZYGR_0AK05080 [Zygosaccharomyces rouxii]|uniref:Uncharacterized protein n=1 Tax=Zygosaccharomyces rouxii TaxID=4956 RepID=A0A1Q3AE08_ZYGRO|nr:hypothetical protein ZYGR_0AK05080 [Zygosaccharomyces rouxii]
MFQMIISPLLYLVSSVIPLQITLETLKIVCSHTKNEPNTGPNAHLPTLILLLKYWAVYALAFGVVPGAITNGIIWGIPFASLILLGLSCILTKELLCQFTKFIQSQDSKFVFLFNRLSDVKVSWYQWLTYATNTNENNIASLFVFGEITQLWVSLANRVPLAETHYLERAFDDIMQYLGVFTGRLLDQIHRRNDRQDQVPGVDATFRRESLASLRSRGDGFASTYNEDYDLLDDLIDESKKK